MYHIVEIPASIVPAIRSIIYLDDTIDSESEIQQEYLEVKALKRRLIYARKYQEFLRVNIITSLVEFFKFMSKNWPGKKLIGKSNCPQRILVKGQKDKQNKQERCSDQTCQQCYKDAKLQKLRKFILTFRDYFFQINNLIRAMINLLSKQQKLADKKANSDAKKQGISKMKLELDSFWMRYRTFYCQYYHESKKIASQMQRQYEQARKQSMSKAQLPENKICLIYQRLY